MIPEYPEYAGALGAALIAATKCKEKQNDGIQIKTTSFGVGKNTTA
jgi:hypothetical protein